MACLGSLLAGRALANEAIESRAASGLIEGKPEISSIDDSGDRGNFSDWFGSPLTGSVHIKEANAARAARGLRKERLPAFSFASSSGGSVSCIPLLLVTLLPLVTSGLLLILSPFWLAVSRKKLKSVVFTSIDESSTKDLHTYNTVLK